MASRKIRGLKDRLVAHIQELNDSEDRRLEPHASVRNTARISSPPNHDHDHFLAFSHDVCWINQHLSHLHSSRGLHPDAKYLTRSSFVICCIASGATMLGAALTFVLWRGVAVLRAWLVSSFRPKMQCRGGKHPTVIICKLQ